MSTISDDLLERRKKLIAQATEIAQKGVTEARDLTGDEQESFDKMIAEADALGARAQAIAEGEQRARDLEDSFRKVTGREPEQHRGDQGPTLGSWAREARLGDAFEVEAVAGAERRALHRYQEHRAMSVGAAGGLGNDGVYGQLWEYAIAASQILQAGVDIIQTADGNTLPLPVVTAHATGASAAANAPITASDAALTVVNLSATKYGYLTLVPSELVQDATFDLEGYLSRAAGRELGNIISKVASDAVIAGFTVSGATAPTASVGATGSVFSDALITLFHSVLPAYRSTAAWLFADPTAAAIRKTKDPQGRYIWETALTAGNPDLVLGKSTYIDPNLPSPTGTAKPIYFGDFSALKVRIAGGLRFERSAEYAFGNDQIAFRAIVRTGAVSTDPNAVKHLALTAA